MQLKIIEGKENRKFVYYPKTHSLFEISPIVGEILDYAFNKNLTPHEISTRCNIPYSQVKEIIEKFNLLIKSEKEKIKKKNKEKKEGIEVKINIAHKCNLKCIYCYANYGTYGTPSLMDETTAISTVHFFEKFFSDHAILYTFFGGEPLLNIKIIEVVCNEVKRLAPDKSRYFGMITNGTIFNNKILDLIKKFKIHLTISIDGPPEVHDKLRKFPNGKGSFSKIASNIEKIKKFCQNEIEIHYELTYTSLHESMGITKEDCVSFLRKKLGLKNGVIVDVTPPSEELAYLKPKFSAKKATLFNFLENPGVIEWYYPFLSYFIHKKFLKYICGIGVSHFTVATNGDIYPCQLFIGHSEFVLGNVKEFLFLEGKYEKAKEILSLWDKEKNEECKNCWAKYMCKDCPGTYYLITKNIKYSGSICNKIRERCEIFLKELGELRCDSVKYNKLIDAIKMNKNISEI